MKIVITGAGGQLGQDIVNYCRVKDLDYCAANSSLLDITHAASVKQFLNSKSPDVIINCAAYNAVDLAEKEWERAYLVNGIGVKNLVLSANKLNAVLVHYSSDYVFDGQANRPYTIAHAPCPVNRYGESKLLGEMILRDLCDSYLLIRVSWVFGAGGDNFAKKILEWSKARKELTVVTDQIASPTYTSDLARATFDLLKMKSLGLYHITNSGHCSRFEWAQYVLKRIGWDGVLIPGKSQDFPSAARRPNFSVLDNFGTKVSLGYVLPHWKDATDRFLQEIAVVK